jgi:hypothetical protein
LVDVRGADAVRSPLSRGWGEVSARLKFAWYDLWVGAFIERNHPDHRLVIYICPLPMLLVVLAFGSRGGAKQTHGRGCQCTPCRAEDWDAIDAGLAGGGAK